MKTTKQTFTELFFKKAAIALLVCLFLIGCFIVKDYGISWDENVQRLQIGELNYRYIKTGDDSGLKANFHKYYGPAFEIILFAAEDIFNITDLQYVFIARHFLTFFAFFLSVICFYLLCFKLFKTHKIALLASAILVLSPRIFADSFYNCKDLATMSFCIIATYTMFVFIQKQTILNAFFHGLACGFVLDVRIMAIVIPVATVYLFLFQKQKKSIPFVVFIFYTLLFTVVFWPILWHNPIHNFIEAYKQMSNYDVKGSKNLFMGDWVPASNLPWYYLPVWIAITTPIMYSILFLNGLCFAIKDIVQNFKNTRNIQVVLFLCITPVMAVIILNSTLYDGWRHLFFVYPCFVIIAVYGFQTLSLKIKNNQISSVISYVTIASLTFTLISIIKNHPYQNVYFNFFAGNNIEKSYEMDYWGLSYKQGLEYILKNDASQQINVAVAHPPGHLNFNSIPEQDRKRLAWTNNFSTANYFLTTYRNHPEDYDFGAPIFRISVDGERVLDVFKLK